MGRLQIALALLFLAQASCSGATPRPPNVVIVLVDTLRPDWLSAYGHPEETSPNIDALSARSVLFEQASAPAPWTLPSVVSLFTSTFLSEHGVVVDGQVLSAEHRTLAELMRDAGYDTASFVANAYAGTVSGMDRGFDHFARLGPTNQTEPVDHWIRRQRSEPFFLYAHVLHPHAPASASAESVHRFGRIERDARRRLRRLRSGYRTLTRVDYERGQPRGTTDNTRRQQFLLAGFAGMRSDSDVLYSAAVHDADRFVGSIIDSLEQAGFWERTLFLFMSDHGEEFGEHGGWLHDQSVYEELVRIPLVIRFPGDRHAGRRIRTPVSLVDILPTIGEAIGAAELPERARGISLLALLREESENLVDTPRVMALRHNRKKFFQPFAELRGDLNVVVREGSWKAIHNADLGTVELYDLASDPLEARDRSAELPERAERMQRFAKRELEGQRARAAATSPVEVNEIAPEDLEALRELGYVSKEGTPAVVK